MNVESATYVLGQSNPAVGSIKCIYQMETTTDSRIGVGSMWPGGGWIIHCADATAGMIGITEQYVKGGTYIPQEDRYNQ
jgi:hypothetical protein